MRKRGVERERERDMKKKKIRGGGGIEGGRERKLFLVVVPATC